jgi:hypothetical protein
MWTGYLQTALIKFVRPQNVGATAEVVLSLNVLAGYTVWGTVTIYGFGSAVGGLVASDGEMLVSPDAQLLGWAPVVDSFSSGSATVDVTSFVRSEPGPYLVFAVTSSSLLELGSLEVGDDVSARLLLTQAVPEPSEAALMFAGLLGLGAWLRRRRG